MSIEVKNDNEFIDSPSTLPERQPSLRLTSIEPSERPGGNIVAAMYAFAWLFVLAWYVAAFEIATHSTAFAMLILGCDTAFAVYLIYSSLRLRRKTFNAFGVSVDGDLLTFRERDSVTGAEVIDQIDLRLVDRAEYYAYQDAGSLILRTTERSLDLPLWAFPRGGESLLNYLRERDVRILSVGLPQKRFDR